MPSIGDTVRILDDGYGAPSGPHGFAIGSEAIVISGPEVTVRRGRAEEEWVLSGYSPPSSLLGDLGSPFNQRLQASSFEVIEPSSSVTPSPSVDPCRCVVEPLTCTCACRSCVTRREEAAGVPTRYCTRGDHEVPQTRFGRRPSGRYQSWCRDCTNEHTRTRRATEGASRPRTSTQVSILERRFGLEIEVVHESSYDLALAIRRAGIECRVEEYTHNTPRHWKIVGDGSVPHGFEVVSPILQGAEGRRQARVVFNVLRDQGARLTCGTSRCCPTGLHVHYDTSDLTASDLARLVETWHAEQGAIDGLVAPSRRAAAGTRPSEWCRPLDSGDLLAVRQLAEYTASHPRLQGLPLSRDNARAYFGHPRSEGRYRTLNFRVFSLHGTIEIRQHQGTLNASKALAWVLFGAAYIERCKSTEDVQTHTALRDVLTAVEAAGLEPATAAYLSDRATELSRGTVAA